MKYQLIADAYGKIEATTKRLAMTDYLVTLIKDTPKDLIREVTYLTQSKIYPDFMGIEIGIAEQTTITSIAKASSTSKEEVNMLWKEIGDLGQTAEKLLSARTSKQVSLGPQEALTVGEVYETLLL